MNFLSPCTNRLNDPTELNKPNQQIEVNKPKELDEHNDLNEPNEKLNELDMAKLNNWGQ